MRVLDQCTAAVLLGDAEGVITYANKEAGRLFARPVEALVGARVETLLSPDQRGGFQEQWRKALSGEPVTSVATEAQRADGAVAAVELTLLPADIAGSKAVQINLQNLAGLKAAEAQTEEVALLLSKQRRAQSALASIQKVLNSGGEVGEMAQRSLTEAAKATGAQLGLLYSIEVAGKTLSRVACYTPGEGEPEPESIAHASALAKRAITEARPLDGASLPPDAALFIQTGDWKRKSGGIAVHPMRFHGEVIGALLLAGLRPFSHEDSELIGLLSDQIAFVIAHARILSKAESMAEELSLSQKLLEGHDTELLRRSEELLNQDVELLEKNEKLAKVEKLKRDFLEKMSREMRTPLNRIIQHLISILSNEEEQMSEESMEHLRGALGEGTAFSRTLNNIVDLWRLREHQVPVDSKQVHFEAVVDEAIHHVQQVALERNVTIEKDLDGVMGPIKTDLGKLTQIMTEIIGNSVRFTSNGNVTIVAESNNDTLVCKVADTGIGIAADDLPRVFDEFFQVDESASSGFNGAGLGLCIAKHLVELMGGEIRLESEIGRGSVLTLTLSRPNQSKSSRRRDGLGALLPNSVGGG